MTTVIDALRTYFLGCPLMADSRLNIDYLPEKGVEYSIDTSPAEEIIKSYMSGSTLRQYSFTVSSVNDYGSDTLQNMANSGFFEKLSSWLEDQTKKRNFPLLDEGRTVRKIEALSTGYLMSAGPDVGKYMIQCRLTFFQKGDRI